MKLPSGSSLLVTSLAVSLSSSSSLSALAAPTGDLPEDSSSPNPVAHCRDGAVARSVDHPQSRDMLLPVKEAVGHLVGDVGHLVDGLLGALAVRDSESAADEDSTSPDSTTAPPQPPAPPPAPPSSPVVNPPVSHRNFLLKLPIQRRDPILDNIA